MKFKIAFIGAGSIGFTRTLLTDILSVPEFHDVEIAFTDINEDNLNMVTALCQRDIQENGLSIKIYATTDRRAAVKDAKYVINVVRIGGLEAFATDIDIPLGYGVDQCVGDTLCAGGLMYAQRGIYAVLEFCKDIREVARPDCILLNYANPNAMITWACNKYGGVPTIGLCHGVQGGHTRIAEVLGLPQAEVDITCVGINHQTWYTEVKHKGEDMNRKLLEGLEAHPRYSKTEKVRIDMMKRFGYFSTESNGHLSEYLPWYRKNEAEVNRWVDTEIGDWIDGETAGYLRVCTEGRNWFSIDAPNWLKEPAKKYEAASRSSEHASYIMEGLETGRVYRGHFNVVNNGVITNLPEDAIVEVPGYVDIHGVNIPVYGALPLGCAAVCNASISVQRMGMEAAVHGDATLLKQAMMMDPLVGAVCNPDEIWQMTDELLVAQEKWLPQYQKAIEQAKEKLASDKLVPKKACQGAARKSVKTIEQMEKDREAATKNAQAAAK